MNAQEATPLESHRTTCCIVGAGPGGAMLALLLAHRGVSVTLLEAEDDLDRQFRGDTLHPSILKIVDQIGLSERLHALPHVKFHGPRIPTPQGPFQPVDLSRLKTKFGYIMLIHQPLFLGLLIDEAKRYPHFELRMGANVRELIESEGRVHGVIYRTDAGAHHEVRALLTVGADGRFSRLRHLGGFEAKTTSLPVELVWFRLPKPSGSAGSVSEPFVRCKPGRVMIVLDRADHFQVAHLLGEGEYRQLHSDGVESLRRDVVELEPRFAEMAESLKDWEQLFHLKVTSSCCRRWHKPGLLLIGDAAHTMTPAAGAGIKYAIEDAVEAANVLTQPLLEGRVSDKHLCEVQRRRIWPTRVIQWFGAFAVRHVIHRALREDPQFRIPLLLRLILRFRFLRDLAGWFIAFGIRRVRLEKVDERKNS